ncbi:MAG: hypothetical protein ACLGP3_12110 [Acidobacteriota bacterium]
MISLLVSLAALLTAAAGVARHIRNHHAKLRRTPHLDPSHEAELEPWRKI